jgi:diaminopimelate epimerase
LLSTRSSQIKYSNYHALGNNYLVIAPEDINFESTPEKIERICHRNFGIGSDGILLGSLSSKSARFGLRIFNPDGSEAEKNGKFLYSR